jgi:hypothetical protein
MNTDSYTHLLRYEEELEMEIEDATDRCLAEIRSMERYAEQARKNLDAGSRLPSGFDPVRTARDLEIAGAQRQQHIATLSKVRWMIRTSTEQLAVDASNAARTATKDA